MSELTFKSATKLAKMIQAKEISALELLEHYLERVERYNPDLNAVIVLDVERARARKHRVRENKKIPLKRAPQRDYYVMLSYGCFQASDHDSAANIIDVTLA